MSVARLLLICLVAASPLLATAPAKAEPFTLPSVALVDTLAGASPDTRFSIFGSSGFPFFGVHPFGGVFVGPQFTITERRLLMNVGGFVNSCESILNGVPQCASPSPIGLQIRPAIGGNPDAGPDPRKLVGSYALSDDADPLTISFESASPRLFLEPGTYYALFTLPPGEGGTILGAAQDPFDYASLRTTFGMMDPVSGSSFVRLDQGAVRVTVAPVPEPSTLALLALGGAASAFLRRRRRTNGAIS
jgi:hypothetical protein